MIMKQIRKIKDWQDYGVTRDGKVWSYANNIWLKQTSIDGYLTVTLCKNGMHKTARVHRLVFETFVRQLNKGEHVHHISHIRTDNNVQNLEAISSSTHTRMHKKGFTHSTSEQTKRKISNTLKGHKVSEETRQKILQTKRMNGTLHKHQTQQSIKKMLQTRKRNKERQNIQ